MLGDLGETSKRSNLHQIKVLLGSIFPSGLAWGNNGTFNHTISPIYQAMRSFEEDSVLSSADERTRTQTRQV